MVRLRKRDPSSKLRIELDGERYLHIGEATVARSGDKNSANVEGRRIWAGPVLEGREKEVPLLGSTGD